MYNYECELPVVHYIMYAPSQVILTIMKSRPRYDPDSAYFTATFDLESRILATHRELVRGVVEVASEDERGWRRRLWQDRSQIGGDYILSLFAWYVTRKRQSLQF